MLRVTLLCLTLAALFPTWQANLRAQSADAAAQTTSLTGNCFGPIQWTVTVGQPLADPATQDLHQAIQQTLNQINNQMSTYRDDSDVSRFNQSTSTDWFPIAPETATVVQQAQEYSQQTQGAFDITVGPLVLLWKFGPAGNGVSQEKDLPSPEEVEQVLQSVGYQKLEVRLDPPALKKSDPELQIDLSAIAKGYAVDRVAEAIKQLGYNSFFVEVGEEVRAAGRHPADRPWICAIEKPVENRRIPDRRVALNDSAIATSGDYRQYQQVKGQRITHTIDPRTGQPTAVGIALASVSADSCMQADAMATAMMVLSPQQSMKLAQEKGLGVLLVHRDASGGLESQQNQAYPSSLADRPNDTASWWLPVGISVLVFGIAVVSMSVGVIFKREPIKGSCGGLANMPGNTQSACDLCSNPSKECREMGRGAAQQETAKT